MAALKTLEEEIDKTSRQIKALQLPDEDKPIVNSSSLSIPFGKNIKRGATEEWNIYQYQLQEYQELQDLPEEVEFLEGLSNVILNERQTAYDLVMERMQNIEKRENTYYPTLRPISTHDANLPVLTWEQKLAKAEAIGQMLCASLLTQNDVDTGASVEELQKKLLRLEDEYLCAL